MISSDKIIGCRIDHFTQLDSTNAEARRMIERGKAQEGMVITTDYQTQGRGQYGRTWDSEANLNIMLSVVVSPTFIKTEDQFLLNICTSLAIQQLVSRFCNNVKVKWPNDIYVNNKKIAGILIQNFIQADTINYSIIGIGLNVNQQEWSEEITNATSLSIESDKVVNKTCVFDKILLELEAVYKQLQLCPQQLRDSYQLRLFGRNEISVFQKDQKKFQGIIKGIDQMGRLLIEHNGQIIAYIHGEISQVARDQ